MDERVLEYEVKLKSYISSTNNEGLPQSKVSNDILLYEYHYSRLFYCLRPMKLLSCIKKNVFKLSIDVVNYFPDPLAHQVVIFLIFLLFQIKIQSMTS